MSVKCLEWPTHVNCEDLLILGIEIIFPSLKKILKVVVFRCEYISTPARGFNTTRFWRLASDLACGSFFSVFSDSKQETKDWNASCGFIHYLWQWHVLKVLHIMSIRVCSLYYTCWMINIFCNCKSVRTREGLYSTSETTEFCLALKAKTRILHAIYLRFLEESLFWSFLRRNAK